MFPSLLLAAGIPLFFTFSETMAEFPEGSSIERVTGSLPSLAIDSFSEDEGVLPLVPLGPGEDARDDVVYPVEDPLDVGDEPLAGRARSISTPSWGSPPPPRKNGPP